MSELVFHPHPFNKHLLKTYYEPSTGSLAHVMILFLSNYSRSIVFKVDLGALGDCWDPWRRLRGPITLTITLGRAVPLLLTFSHGCAVEFSRGYGIRNDAIALTVNGMCACVYFCFDSVSISISKKVNINKPSSYKQKHIL